MRMQKTSKKASAAMDEIKAGVDEILLLNCYFKLGMYERSKLLTIADAGLRLAK